MSFALILVVLVAVTGLLSLLDVLYFARKRKQTLFSAQKPKWAEYARSFFPVLLAVLLIRSFIIEPFRIPSSSLEPTLLVGDFVAVNKFIYGLRLPVVEKKVFANSAPKHGDIVVFRWPPNPRFDYIKRVVGLPGDKIRYKNKVFTINGIEAKQVFESKVSLPNYPHFVERRQENLLGVKHSIYIDTTKPAKDFSIEVPKGSYFMIGDNRDNSSDSRYWGVVPEANLRGKAFIIWMSWNSLLNRVRWNRLGKSI